MLYDVFISHASEDKDTFVRPLAEALREKRLEVWYDEYSLRIGDSLRRSIDDGLSKSRYGIVVLSKDFFRKNWTNWELDGLIQRFNFDNKNVILPIWYNVTHKDVLSYSPSLADKFSINSTAGLETVVQKLLEVINPEGSTLLIARDILLDYGCEPPVITDDWWLDVIESSASNPVENTFQSAMGWGRWGFPLPEISRLPVDRGNRIAWAAMQMLWQEKADKLNISQVTQPNKVLDFIRENPGLREMCLKNIPYLLAYAPQLSIKGFGGDFEEGIEKILNISCAVQEDRREKNDFTGSGLTTDKKAPGCHEMVALRHPQFGYYDASFIACWYVQGDIMGPDVKHYGIIDYIAWFLSDDSNWMPHNVREYLLYGLKEWAKWDWSKFSISDYDLLNQLSINSSYHGALYNALNRAESYKNLKLGKRALYDLRFRLDASAKILGLKESGSDLSDRFIRNGFIEMWLNEKMKRH